MSGTLVGSAALGAPRPCDNDQTYWFTEPVAAPRREPHVHLLPRFDEYLVAYRRREDVVDAAMGKPQSISLVATPVVVRDGKVIGSWRHDKPAMTTTTLATTLTGPEQRSLDAAIKRFLRFLADPP